jgi:hypothetical protein
MLKQRVFVAKLRDLTTAPKEAIANISFRLFQLNFSTLCSPIFQVFQLSTFFGNPINFDV